MAMDFDLNKTTVGDVCEVFDGPHATPSKTASGPIFLGITSLENGRINLSEVEHLSEEDFVRWTRRVTPRPGDVIFSYETKLGEAALIPQGLRCCLGRRMALLRPDPVKADSRYLLYYYLGPEFQNVIRERTIHGSTVDRLPLVEFPRFPLRLPPLAKQKAIASVLGALDDKIELNRRMNATLEAMTRALFQSWFVDFDPVRASLNAHGRSHVVDDTNTAFFGSFQDSHLGPIPEGWTTGSILRQANLLSGGTPKTDVPAYWNGEVPWASAKDVSQCNDAFLLATERTLTQKGVDESTTKIIPAFSTVIVARGATTGRLTMFSHAMAMNQTCYGLRSKVNAPFALYCLTRHFVERLVHGGHGSIFNTITTSTFEATDVLLAPERVSLAFEERVTPLFQRILANLRESRTLATLRDVLLPKLLSGEVRISLTEASSDALKISAARVDDMGDLSVSIDGYKFRAGEKITFIERGWAVFLAVDSVPDEWMRRFGETIPADEGWSEVSSGNGMLVTSHPVLVALSLRAWMHRDGNLIPTAPQVPVPGFAEAVEAIRQRHIIHDFNQVYAGKVPGLEQWQPDGKIVQEKQDQPEHQKNLPVPTDFSDSNVLQFPDAATRKATDEFVEAVLIARLVKTLAKPEYPVGRFRYNKLAYLAHRKVEDDTTKHYLKKAAGPYSPWAKYSGPENIAKRNGYIREANVGGRKGFLPADKIDKIEPYAAKYPACAAVDWIISLLRYRKNDDLEVLSTVDFAAVELVQQGQAATLETVKRVIATNTEWAPKLKREIFSDENIASALVELATIYPALYKS